MTTLLNLLADGKFYSGQALADALGVSRTAVWKRVNKLEEELGLQIESVKGKGYRLPGGVDPLDSETILGLLSVESRGLLSELSLCDVIDSTNTELLRRAASGGRSGHVLSVEQQTAGRGRRGREWVSPYASNIYLSVLWEFEQGAAAIEGLSLATGVAVARALGQVGVPGVALKWPNDVLHGGAKLGGILLEMSGDAAGPCQVVVGVGLNVRMPASAGGNIDQAWTDVASSVQASCPSRSQLLATLLNEMLPLLANFENAGFAGWKDAWQALDAFAGEQVVLHAGDSKTAGIARGVNERGALILETTAGKRPVYGGEISMRPVL